MPSSRAILFDIHELGLDPKKPHRRIKASGRLAASVDDETVTAPQTVDVKYAEQDQISPEAQAELKAAVAVSNSSSLTTFNQPEEVVPEAVVAAETVVTEPELPPTPVQETTPDHVPVVSKGRRNKNANQ